jgi:hypothetical protein
MHIKKNVDVFLLSQSSRQGILEVDFFSWWTTFFVKEKKFFFCRLIDTLSELYLKVMFK